MIVKYLLFLLFAILISWAAKIEKSSLSEIDFIEIKLDKKIASPNAEFSGLDWFKDELILLPQYPERFSSNYNGCLFSISKYIIIDYLKNEDSTEINLSKIEFDSKGIESKIEGFQGYEALVFNNDDVYFSIEAEISGQMHAYIIKGKINSDVSKIRIQPKSLKEIPLPANINNMAFETLLIAKNKVIAIYEANGINININPIAVSFDLDLEQYKNISFPNIEYRITDATQINNEGSFWAINYLYEGDYDLLNPARDSLFEKYNSGMTQTENRVVERIIKFKINGHHFYLEDIAPIQIKLNDEKDSGNWEGIVKFDSLGFLVITDKFPRTILAYIPYALGNNDLVIFEKSGKIGFRNALEIEVIKPQFVLAQEFSEKGIAAVVDDSGWVYINKTGKKMIRPHIIDNGPDYFCFGLARFEKNKKYGFFDEEGQIKILPQFDYARPFADSVAAVCKGCILNKNGEHFEITDGKWGFINLKGDLIIPYNYEKVSDFSSGLANVSANGKTVIINRSN